ncbi:MAG: aryl-sulfate sulfotransferase [Ignavibacteriaceae bacterium]
MKSLFKVILLIFFLLINNPAFSQSFQYVYPKDNSTLVSLKTDIILKSTSNIDLSSLFANEFTLTGNKSGVHSGIVKLSDDNKTIIFVPDVQFSAGEDISVIVKLGIKTIDGKGFPQLSFHFETTPLEQRININPLSFVDDGHYLNNTMNSKHIYKSITQSFSTDSLPSDFPKITVGTSNNPGDGKIFLANFSAAGNDSIGNYIMILNNDGSVVKYKKLSEPAFDFKVQPNGELSYADVITMGNGYAAVRWIVMDTSLTPVDTFQCGNGYTADLHDFLLLPNGHAILVAFDPEPVDMSQIVSDGNPDAIVIGGVIQELDASKNVVFQWRSWDYLPITDSYEDLTTPTVDYLHLNSLDVDNNGNIIASSRHLSTIFKIDRESGDLIWMLGGKQNQFSFINEHEANYPNYFSYQHDVKLQPNGDITLFDNGNQHTPLYSRAAEYQLDEQNKTATLVWEYRHSPDIFNFAMGSVQKFSDGNTLIGWGMGSASGAPALTEIHSDNSTALELYLPQGEVSYRAFRFPWASQTPDASVTIDEAYQGNTYKFNNNNDTTGITIKFDQLSDILYANAIVTKYNYAPLNPLFATTAPIITASYFSIKGQGISSYTGEFKVNLNNFPEVTSPQKTIIYVRQTNSNSFIPLATSYDSTNNELLFTTSDFGDFAFGIPQDISTLAPVPLSPPDSGIINFENPVDLIWGTRGVVQSYHIQVSSDSTFKNLLVDESNLTSTSYMINPVMNNSTYFWRVNNLNSAGTSNWSNVYCFYSASPYIKISYPDGDDNIYSDSTYIIRWETNISDTVSIELLSNNNLVFILADSIFSGTNAFVWKVPSNIKPDSSYKIIILSISNPKLFALSNNAFAIESGIAGVTGMKVIAKDFNLSQNYPNPFNPSTIINYSIPTESNVRITVFNAIGQKITTLVNATKQSGDYQVTWNASQLASGIYFYYLKATTASGNNFFMVKKMVLLK